MKNLLIVLLLTINTAALAQPSETRPTRTSITDDGSTLTIQIDRPTARQPVHYRQTFDVSDMNRFQKEWLIYRVFANQGVALPLDELMGLGVVAGLLALLAAVLMVGYRTLKTRQLLQQTH